MLYQQYRYDHHTTHLQQYQWHHMLYQQYRYQHLQHHQLDLLATARPTSSQGERKSRVAASIRPGLKPKEDAKALREKLKEDAKALAAKMPKRCMKSQFFAMMLMCPHFCCWAHAGVFQHLALGGGGGPTVLLGKRALVCVCRTFPL